MKPTRIIVHCSATENGKRVGIEEITKWHIGRGFKTVGYHIVIEPDGEVERGRPLNEVGAHCEGANHDSIGICLIGNDKFSLKQFDVLRYQIESILMTYPIRKWDVYCHRQFGSAIKQGKTCPNIPINNLLHWLDSRDDSALELYLLKD
jgi:hypothetical protein